MRPARLQTIDGLRGVAAFGVVLFHLNQALALTFDNWVHPVLQWGFEQGFLGVEVFFVLSGFVIPYSVRNANLNVSFLGRFALRRSVRLDPPYWVAILLETFCIWVGLRVGLTVAPLPTWPQFFSHLVYAQNILGYGNIADIFWTLCFEIQFYLALIALLVIGEKLRAAIGPARVRALAIVVLSVLYVYSVLGRYTAFGIEIHEGFALIRWFQFFMGTCVYWLVSGKTGRWPLIGTWVVLIAVLIIEQESVLQAVPILTSALLWLSYARDRMATILSNRAVQFLGVISYSLYLFHGTVGWRWIRLIGLYVPRDAHAAVVLLVFASGCAVSIAFAWGMWRILELPSMRLSRRIGLREPSTPRGDPDRG